MSQQAPSWFTAVPATLEELLEPRWLSHALDDITPDEEVVAVEQVDATQTLAQKIRFTVTVDGPSGRRTTPYCVKGHFDGGPNTLRPEALFYRDVRQHVEMNAPRCYYAAVDDDANRALAVMDDVVAAGGRFLNAFEPYSIDTCKDTLGQLARLHASTWGDERWKLDWLAPRIGSMAASYPTELLQKLLDDGRGPDSAPPLRDAGNLKAAMAATAERFGATCVIHGDTQSGNAYVDGAGKAGWLDWQVTQWSHWAIDVSYHVACVLTVEDRRAHEEALLRHYLDALAALGVRPPAWNDAWRDYTLALTHGYFLWVITRVSSREVVLIHIPRIATALADHDTYRRLGVG